MDFIGCDVYENLSENTVQYTHLRNVNPPQQAERIISVKTITDVMIRPAIIHFLYKVVGT